jgi:hypothetical protein
LSCLRYVGVLLGGDGNCPQKLWYVNGAIPKLMLCL